jgi:glutamine synthetase
MSKNGKPTSSYFGENLFDFEKMKKNLPKPAFDKLSSVIYKNQRLDLDTANIVASALKEWATQRGCTHYTHWFQPMTGFTAEKHDSFIEHAGDGKVIESFSGKQLIQGEPDASSFPSGGLRTTFEARGYSIWDPTSPAFILEYPHGNTLCIPSIFVSYRGETLDKKAPLLRSVQALNKSALNVLRYFNNPATRVFSTLGVEQEYFLIDREYYNARPDLIQAGRTLFGKLPAKHQQLEDQYFGNIPERAFGFMTEFEQEAYKLGIPVKTRHNEVAPNQFEVAPLFEDVNIAIDHNQILMDLMDRVAKRQGLAVLFHEKPFASVNGSGKHCNWAMQTDTGENLLNPGHTPQSNLQFLIFLVSTIKAVHDYSRELRAAIASAGNDHRLGANEAPPAIISVFLGETLTRVLNDLASGRVTETIDQAWISAGIDKISEIPRDNTDRNRTSPFAFTGNKFEFRAVGASQTPASAITALNTAVAAALDEARQSIDARMNKGSDFNTASVESLRAMVKTSVKILFEGDNYSKEWEREAHRRGLPNIKTTPEAVRALISKSAMKLYTTFKVYNERELESHFHIDMENYIKQVDIEAAITKDMAMTMYLPCAIRYLNDITESVSGLRETLGRNHKSIKHLAELAGRVSTLTSNLRKTIATLDKIFADAKSQQDLLKKGMRFLAVREQTQEVRVIIDELEGLVADSYWPVPKYKEMLLIL